MTFTYRVDRWTDEANSILDYVAAIAITPSRGQPFEHHASDGRRLRITSDRGARVVKKNW